MPRVYKRRSNRPDVSEANVELAMKAVLEKELSIRKAASKYALKPATLQHRLKKKKKLDESPNVTKRTFEKKFTSNQIFTADEEKELEHYIRKCNAINYDLTLKAVRVLAYDYACALPNCKYPKKWDEDKLAGIEWMNGFRLRHPCLRLRKHGNIGVTKAAHHEHKENGLANDEITIDIPPTPPSPSPSPSPPPSLLQKEETPCYPLTQMSSVVNEFEFFGKNVAAQLQSLPLEMALETQELLLSILRQQRLKALRLQSNCNDIESNPQL